MKNDGSLTRPSSKCGRRGCDARPEFQMGFKIYPPKEYGDVWMPGETSLYLCGPCGREARVEDLMTDEAWRIIVLTARIAGKVEPDRSRLKIDLKPILNL